MPVTVIVRSGGSPRGVPPRSPRERPATLSITCDSPLLVIGRGEGCDVRLPDPSVSHRHATIRQRGHEYILVDEGSTNGTFIGTVKLGAQAPRLLKHGELARVGRVWLEIRFDNQIVPPPQSKLATKELALALVARALSAQGELGGPRVTVTSGPDQGKSMSLDEAGRAYVIGRGQEVDFVLEDSDASRRHVQIVRRADQLLVRDLGSKNFAELGGRRLDDRDHVWKLDEELRLGKNTLAYHHPAIEALNELEHAADEKIREGESILPPEPTAAQASRRDATPVDRHGAPSVEGPLDNGTSAGGSAPIAEVPRQSGSAPPRKGGWSGTDVIVVLLAVGVLALSVAGLFWLLKG